MPLFPTNENLFRKTFQGRFLFLLKQFLKIIDIVLVLSTSIEHYYQ